VEWNAPDFTERVIITPGLSKYQKLQLYRQELLQSADAAIDKANHFLFLGYGFNDNHLDEYIRRKLIMQSCNGLIVTRDSNPRIKALLLEADNLWLVCKDDDGMSEGTRIFNKKYSDCLRLPAKRLWDIYEFTTQILGG
jgi:DNA-binding LacI/PurR family transcriptional regulator